MSAIKGWILSHWGLILLGGVILSWFVFMDLYEPAHTDDSVYLLLFHQFHGQLIPLLQYRYVTWESRLILAFVAFSLISVPLVAKFLYAGLMLGLILLTEKLLKVDPLKMNPNIFRAGLAVLFLTINHVTINETGVVVNPAYYLVPFFCFVLGIYLDRNHLFNGQVFCVSALFLVASNSQQVYVLVGVYLLSKTYTLIKNRMRIALVVKKLASIYVPLVINGLLILLSPGNQVRALTEAKLLFPNLAHPSLGLKFELSLMATTSDLINQSPLPLFAFMLLSLAHLVLLRRKKLLLPLIFSFAGFVAFVFSTHFSVFSGYLISYVKQPETLIDPSFLTFTALTIFWGALLILFIRLVSPTQRFIASSILVAAIGSKLLLVLTPSVLSANIRSDFFLVMTIELFSFWLLKEILEFWQTA